MEVKWCRWGSGKKRVDLSGRRPLWRRRIRVWKRQRPVVFKRNEDDFDLVPFFFWRSPSLVSSSESFFSFQVLYFSLGQQREEKSKDLFIHSMTMGVVFSPSSTTIGNSDSITALTVYTPHTRPLPSTYEAQVHDHGTLFLFLLSQQASIIRL